jgi:hypothetical protein
MMPPMADSDDLLQKFFGSHREQLLVQHVLREIRAGRDLDDVLDDAYVTNRADPLEIRSLLDHVEIARAVGDEAVARIKSQM